MREAGRQRGRGFPVYVTPYIYEFFRLTFPCNSALRSVRAYTCLNTFTKPKINEGSSELNNEFVQADMMIKEEKT